MATGRAGWGSLYRWVNGEAWYVPTRLGLRVYRAADVLRATAQPVPPAAGRAVCDLAAAGTLCLCGAGLLGLVGRARVGGARRRRLTLEARGPFVSVPPGAHPHGLVGALFGPGLPQTAMAAAFEADPDAWPVYADWLEDQGWPGRAAALRAAHARA
jgi:uncharacterized protein (TIGR02996 family)